jgi:hypothetical protein
VNEKTKGKYYICVYRSLPLSLILLSVVDENLFYKGVDKKSVHGARLHKSNSLSEPSYSPLGNASSPQEQPVDEEHPPFPFESGHSLLMLTKKHNVGLPYFIKCGIIYSPLQMTIAQIVYDNEFYFGLSDRDIHNKVAS